MKIALVNPPFATIRLPSLGLAQLRARTTELFGDRVASEICHVNLDFAAFLGVEIHEQIAQRNIYSNGFGDWYFRQLAFPEEPDNSEAYLRTYFRNPGPDRDAVLRALEKRSELNAFFDRIIEKYALDAHDVVGFTAMFFQTTASVAMATKIKAMHPDAITLIGGARCEGEMGKELAARFSSFDYVFSGPGLKSFPEFVQAVRDGTVKKKRIRGVIPRAVPGPRLDVADRGAELGDELGINEELDLHYEDYLAAFDAIVGKLTHEKPQIPFETSRGCWWAEVKHCTFCGLMGSTIEAREMASERALRQFGSLFRLVPRVTFFQAVDNIMPHGYLKSVFPHLKPPADVTIYYEVKSNMNEDDVRRLAESNVRVVQPGIECFNTAILKLMNKGVTAHQNVRFLMYCTLHGVAPKWSFIIGFPEEPEDSYPKLLKDMELLWHVAPPADVGHVRFDRFSPYYMHAAEYGLDLCPMEYYRLTFPFDDESLTKLAYYFVNRDPRFYVPVGRWRKKMEQAVATWQRRWTGADQLLPARLYLESEDEVSIVRDTRSGRLVEHRLDRAAATVLAFLKSPKSCAQIASSELSDVPGFDAEQEVSRLLEKRLLFEENGLFVSLVMPRVPATMPSTDDGPWNYERLSHVLTQPNNF